MGMLCNNPTCSRLGTDGEELRSNFLVTACGHAFCSDCTKIACREALCLYCKCELTDETTSICNPEEQQLVLQVCGLEPAQIMSITSRALQFYVNQIQLRCQMESDRVEQVESKNAKLKQAMKELLSTQVSAVNILKSRASALEKELEIEKRRAASSQKKLLEEMRQKRRLEDEAQQRRWQRSTFMTASFSSTSPKRIKAAPSGLHQVTNSGLVGRQRDDGADQGGGAAQQQDVHAIKPHSAPPHQVQGRFQEILAEDERHHRVEQSKREKEGSMHFSFQDPNLRHPSDSNHTMRPSVFNDSRTSDARTRTPPRR